VSGTKLQIDRRSLEAKIGTVIANLMEASEQLQALSIELENKGELNQRADSDEVKQAATAVKATALHALNTAASAIGLSERLAMLGSVLSLAEGEAP